MRLLGRLPRGRRQPGELRVAEQVRPERHDDEHPPRARSCTARAAAQSVERPPSATRQGSRRGIQVPLGERRGSSSALVARLAIAGEAWAGPWNIDPGQEALLLARLGGSEELPGGCHLSGASVEKALVVARYTCAAGPVRVELHHPSDAPPAAPRTASFALVAPPGEPAPPALIDAIAARLRAAGGRVPAGRRAERAPGHPSKKQGSRAPRASVAWSGAGRRPSRS